jgi:hypothetical protein
MVAGEAQGLSLRVVPSYLAVVGLGKLIWEAALFQ